MKFFYDLKSKVKSMVDAMNEDRVMLVPISKLTFDKEFKELFEQEEDKVNRIAANMRESGGKFDKSQPVIINELFQVLDGHSRLMAAKIVGLKTVPVIMKKFSSKEAALEYELHLQLDRRNLTDSQIYAAYKKKASLKKADESLFPQEMKQITSLYYRILSLFNSIGQILRIRKSVIADCSAIVA